MRINLLRTNRGVASTFVGSTIKDFAEEYDFTTVKLAKEYVCTGKQGLRAYTEWLKARGYRCEMYALEPNRDMFCDVGERFGEISRSSPSYGIIMADDCPQWVEFKLKNL